MYKEISDLSLFYKPRPTDSVCTKKTPVGYFSVQTSRSVNKKLLIGCYLIIYS
jgi:hypothetical protein